MKDETLTPQQKSAQTRRNKLSFKEKKFAKEFVKTGNGLQSALKVYDTTDHSTAGVIAHENLNKPKVKEEIASLLRENGIEMSSILEIHNRNMLQDKHLPTSQKAVGDFYEILGMKSQEKPTSSIKIAFVIEK